MLALQIAELRVALPQGVQNLRDARIARRQRFAQGARLALRTFRFAQRLLGAGARGFRSGASLGQGSIQIVAALLLRRQGGVCRRKIRRRGIGARDGGSLRLVHLRVRPGERFIVGLLPRDPLLDRAHAFGKRGQIDRHRPGKVRMRHLSLERDGRMRRRVLEVRRRVLQSHGILRHIVFEERAFEDRQPIGALQVYVAGLTIIDRHTSSPALARQRRRRTKG